MSKTVFVLITAAVVTSHGVLLPGQTVEIPEEEGAALKRRGKAEHADGPATAELEPRELAAGEKLEDASDSLDPAKVSSEPIDLPVPEEATEAKPPDGPVALEDLTKPQLLEKAKVLGVEVKSSDSKAAILAALQKSAT